MKKDIKVQSWKRYEVVYVHASYWENLSGAYMLKILYFTIKAYKCLNQTMETCTPSYTFII